MTAARAQKPQPTPPPQVHPCATCAAPHAPCGIGSVWLCVRCAPAEFWPHNRETGK
jgi:hypothetical protein